MVIGLLLAHGIMKCIPTHYVRDQFSCQTLEYSSFHILYGVYELFCIPGLLVQRGNMTPFFQSLASLLFQSSPSGFLSVLAMVLTLSSVSTITNFPLLLVPFGFTNWDLCFRVSQNFLGGCTLFDKSIPYASHNIVVGYMGAESRIHLPRWCGRYN